MAQVAAVQGDDGQGAELLLHHVTLVAPAGADLPHLPDDILHLPLPHEAQVDAVQGDVGQGAELLLHQLTLVSTVGAELPHPPDDLSDDLHHLSLPQVANVGAVQGDGAGLLLPLLSPRNPSTHRPDVEKREALLSRDQGVNQLHLGHRTRVWKPDPTTIFTSNLCRGKNVPVNAVCTCHTEFC